MTDGSGALEALLGLVPAGPDAEFCWEALRGTPLGPLLDAMGRTPQNPVYHAEGDVLAHTRGVCRALTALPAYPSLPRRRQQELFLAALLHDLGKLSVTRLEDGVPVSPRHAVVGSAMVRELLWLEYGLCGTPEKQNFRETVCALVRFHMHPERLLRISGAAPERALRTAACAGIPAPDFCWSMLCLLAEADLRGRIAPDVEALVEQVQLSALLAEELGCLDAPPFFASDHTRRAYCAGRNVAPEQPLYRDSWGEVVLMSGLAGTGKDTWIARFCPEHPVVSLDGIRRELGAAHGTDEARVVHLAQERANQLLRERRPFVWNATGLSGQQRKKQIDRFERYGAHVRVVYLETAWAELLRRNAARPAQVPEHAIAGMLQRLEPPMPWEADAVEWICV